MAPNIAHLNAHAGAPSATTASPRVNRATAPAHLPPASISLAAGLCLALGTSLLLPALLPIAPAQTAIEIAPANHPRHIQTIVPQIARHRPSHHAPVTVSAVDAKVTITDQVATTFITFAMTNPGAAPAEAQVVIPVPEGVAVRSIHYDGVSGPSGEPNAELLPRESAREIYDAIVRSMRDPALVEFVGFNLIKTSAFPIAPGATQRITLTYEQILTSDSGRVEYVLPRSQTSIDSPAPWTIDVTVNASRAIALLHSASHAINVERPSPTRCVAHVPPGQGNGPFRLTFATEPTDPGQLAYSLLTFPQSPFTTNPAPVTTVNPGEDAITATPIATSSTTAASEGGYFMLVVAPPTSAEPVKSPTREVVLVLDRSGSMRGEKWTQAQAAAIQVIDGLNDGELFNIIDYSDSIASYAPDPVAKDPTTTRDARDYIQKLGPSGGTNIHDALLEALRANPADATLPMILFLTDGLPTIGERNETRIRDAVIAANTSNRRIFTFGVGHDVNFPLISAIATSSRGATTVVDPAQDVETKVSQVFKRLNGPVLTSPSLGAIDAAGKVSTRLVREIMPPVLPDVFDGDQIIVLGQYTGSEPFKVRISGTFNGTERTWDIPVDPAAASLRNGFVPRLWATRKVGLLADQARQIQADPSIRQDDPRLKEIVGEIVALSTRFGVLSEYTAFLAREDSGARINLGQALRETQDNVGRMAGGMRTGTAGAAQQADLDQKQLLSVAPASAPAWRDLDNNEVRATSVNNIAAQTYFNRQNIWIDARIMLKDAANETANAANQADLPKPDETIAFGTPEYAALALRLAERHEQSILAQQGDIMLQLDDRIILVQAPTSAPDAESPSPTP